LVAYRKKPLLASQSPRPTGFLRLAGYCRIWILNLRFIVKPLYEALIRTDLKLLIWTKECQTAFKTLKDPLKRIPALALPNI
jgi:hypothetical protein